MNSKHRKTLSAIFADPVKADIKWADIEALFVACGGSVKKRVAHECALNWVVFLPISTVRIRNRIRTRARSNLFAAFCIMQESTHEHTYL